MRDAGQSRRACLVHAAVGLRCDASVGLRCDARSTARSGASGHDADSTRKDVHETNVHSDDLVLSQELASASQTETRLNASSSAGSGAGEEEAFGWDIRPLTPSGEVDTDAEMKESRDLSASRGPATPVLWV